MRTVVANGTLVLPDGLLRDDMLIEDGKIARIGRLDGKELGSCQRTYDAAGCLVFPGFIDAHTHLEMDTGSTVTADSFETGTKAALAGGTTTIIDFATQEKGGTLADALKTWHARADGKCSCNYGFHMAIVDWNERTRRELPGLTAQGVTSYKVYMAYDALRVSDEAIFGIFRAVGREGGLLSAHCENGDIVNCLVRENLEKGNTLPKYHPLSRPDYVEEEAVGRFLAIARAAGSSAYVVHLSTRAGYERIMKARGEGVKVFAETCPQYLTLTDEVYSLPGFEGAKYVCSPPVRKAQDVQALLEAVRRGDIDTVATDHCSFDFRGQKELGLGNFSRIPNGLPGIEHRPELFYDACVQRGYCSAVAMAKLLAENPARLFGMYPEKGALIEGADADLTVFDACAPTVITADRQMQNVDYTPWEGRRVAGSVKAVFLAGELCAQDGRVIKPLCGRYVKRGPFAGAAGRK